MNMCFSKGVTLIELMVAIAILAIITSIAIPAYNGYIKTSYKAECQTEVSAIKLAQEEHFLEYGSYFSGTSANDLKTNSSSVYAPSSAGLNGNCDYKATAGGNTYTITASGKAGGKLDGEGDFYSVTK
jgi:type IV pilus assembly protein PilE